MEEVKKDEAPAPKENHAVATPDLKFVDGKLHQQFQVHYDDGASRLEFRPVPSETSPKEGE